MHTNDKSETSETPAGSALFTLTEAQGSETHGLSNNLFLSAYLSLPY